jgi:hypothetical protein
MKSIAASFLLLMGLSACVGPFAASPKPALMYQLPDTPELVYITGDTTNVDIGGVSCEVYQLRRIRQLVHEAAVGAGGERTDAGGKAHQEDEARGN